MHGDGQQRTGACLITKLAKQQSDRLNTGAAAGRRRNFGEGSFRISRRGEVRTRVKLQPLLQPHAEGRRQLWLGDVLACGRDYEIGNASWIFLRVQRTTQRQGQTNGGELRDIRAAVEPRKACRGRKREAEFSPELLPIALQRLDLVRDLIAEEPHGAVRRDRHVSETEGTMPRRSR
jgi:hypothetical protein